AVTMLAQTSNRQLKLPNNLHRSTDAVSRSRPAWPSANALRQLAFTQAHRPRRSNPHRFSIPRFPPLEVFRRRPPEYRAITVSGRHPKTFTTADSCITANWSLFDQFVDQELVRHRFSLRSLKS